MDLRLFVGAVTRVDDLPDNVVLYHVFPFGLKQVLFWSRLLECLIDALLL